MISRNKLFLSALLLTKTLWGDSYINVNLTEQMAYVYKNNVLIMEGKTSTGREGFYTPTGQFTVLEKDREHTSNEYPKPNGGGEMDFMLRLTYSGIAIHSGDIPDYPDSHGCIRLQFDFAEELFDFAKLGMVVNIYGETPKYVEVKKTAQSKKKPTVARKSRREKIEEDNEVYDDWAYST